MKWPHWSPDYGSIGEVGAKILIIILVELKNDTTTYRTVLHSTSSLQLCITNMKDLWTPQWMIVCGEDSLVLIIIKLLTEVVSHQNPN